MIENENENNDENEELQDDISEIEDRIEFIKYGIVAQIFQAGSNFARYDLKCRGKKGELSHDKEIELQTRISVTLDVLRDTVDLVWNEDFYDDTCENFQQKLDTEKTIEDINDQLKKNGQKE